MVRVYVSYDDIDLLVERGEQCFELLFGHIVFVFARALLDTSADGCLESTSYAVLVRGFAVFLAFRFGRSVIMEVRHCVLSIASSALLNRTRRERPSARSHGV